MAFRFKRRKPRLIFKQYNWLNSKTAINGIVLSLSVNDFVCFHYYAWQYLYRMELHWVTVIKTKIFFKNFSIVAAALAVAPAEALYIGLKAPAVCCVELWHLVIITTTRWCCYQGAITPRNTVGDFRLALTYALLQRSNYLRYLLQRSLLYFSVLHVHS